MRLRTILDLLFPAQCAGCGAMGSGLCGACIPAHAPLRVRLAGLDVLALAAYEGAMRAAVLALKDGRRDVAESLGDALSVMVGPATLLVPVPTTARRRRVRGMDGVTLIAGAAARNAGARSMEALAQQAGDAQRGRTREQRLAASGRFACRTRGLAGQTIVLVDDVCTTGATLLDCARVLREAGVRVERAIVVAAALHEAGEPPPATKHLLPWNAA